jgi:hypothetical protein
MAIESQAYTTLDYDKDGKQFGRLDVPLSTNPLGCHGSALESPPAIAGLVKSAPQSSF